MMTHLIQQDNKSNQLPSSPSRLFSPIDLLSLAFVGYAFLIIDLEVDIVVRPHLKIFFKYLV